MTDSKRTGGLNRRQLFKIAAAGGLAVAAPMVWARPGFAARRIVVRDSGGIFSKVYGDVFYKPFTEATGIEVVGVASNAEPTSQIKGIVDTGSYTWDMASISQAAIAQLTQEGDYLEKHGLEKDGAVAEIPPEFMSPFGVGTNVYSTVLAYRTNAFKGRKAPQSWADFWNVKDYPGRRALRKHPFDTIEEALMAAGTPTDKVYPCDFDKAFATLDHVKPEVSVWWTGGAQQEQMLTSGEVDLIPVWVSRAQAAKDAGAPVGIVWNQQIWGVDSWAILKGTPNADLCREFIRFVSDAKRQAACAPFMAVGPTNPNAYKHIDAKRAPDLPTYPENFSKGLKIDHVFWSRNKDKAIERFNAWVLT